MFKKISATLVLASVAACGADTSESNTSQTEDGVSKPVEAGKGDAWNYRNDPNHLRYNMETLYEALPTEGFSEKVPWAGSYWPMYQDGINHRWLGKEVLSPAEKYDKAFNGWEPSDDFMELKPVDLDTCEFDQEYYDSIGPAADYTTRNHGNYRLVDGIDGDRDGVSDAEECTTNGDIRDWDGLETWFGICHAWAPASLVEDEPLRAVERNGVKFEVSDIKALLMQQYNRTSARLIGGRCNDLELDFDETGRITNPECRDLNAGSWHVAVTNLLGENGMPIVIERTTNYEVWNQPLRGYHVTEQKEISLEEALVLLKLDPNDQAQGNGEFVHEIEEEGPVAVALLELVNEASFTDLEQEVGLGYDTASKIANFRPFTSLDELDAAIDLGSEGFTLLADYVSENNLVNVGSLEYPYNSDAESFVEIRMTTDWITESHASLEPTSDIVERYTRHDHYHYILELDAGGHIIGGEWIGATRGKQVDFIWTAGKPVSGNPHLDLETIRDMVRESRQDLTGDKELEFSNNESFDIPDNDVTGANSVINVDETGAVERVSIDVNVAHSYRGDLLIELKKGPQIVTVYNGIKDDQGWNDDVVLEGFEVEGFAGIDPSGEWTLIVTDNAKFDEGQVVEWSLSLELQ